MKQLLEMLCTAVLLSLGAVAVNAQSLEKPNIVLIMAEDIGNDLACYGHKGVKTPTLDRMAAEGIKYNRFYTNSPICSPSRSSLMMGMYPTSCGAHNHRSTVKPHRDGLHYMTHYLRKAGYACILGTKAINWKNSKLDINLKLNEPIFDKNGTIKLGQPFFQEIQLQVTHRQADSDRWEKLRKTKKNPVKTADVEIPPYLPDTPEVRHDWAVYLDQMEEADNQTQAIIDDLKKQKILDDTIIIWIGDNGRCQIRGKGYLYEDGIRCPLIICGKGIEKGKVVDDLVSGIDLTATILALAGAEQPAFMQGQAFLNNPNYTPQKYIFSARDRWDEIADCSRTLVGKRYKYIYNFMPEVPYDAGQAYLDIIEVRPILPLLRQMYKEGKLTPEQAYFFKPAKEVEQLFDLENDPFELNNLANSPEHQEIRKTLNQELFKKIISTKDLGVHKDDSGKWVRTPEPKGTNRSKQPEKKKK